MGQDADMSGPEVTSVLEKFQVFYDALDEREQLILAKALSAAVESAAVESDVESQGLLTTMDRRSKLMSTLSNILSR
jgi:hypothetical protein